MGAMSCLNRPLKLLLSAPNKQKCAMSEFFLTRKAHMVQCLISSRGTDDILIVKGIQGTSSNCLVSELLRAILMVFAELTGGSWRLRRPVAICD